MVASTPASMENASIFFGLFIGLIFFTAVKAVRQTWIIWHRTKNVWNWYLWMVWIELTVNFVFALTTYLFIHGTIKPSLGYYFGVVVMWAIITQLLLQIIANRVSLIMVEKRKSRHLRWALYLIVGCVNISVFCIWIPGMLGVNHTWVVLNHYWERVEKCIFLLLDLGLNFYFLYLVRSNLIAQGLTKYWPLFNFNAGVVLISTSMDILLLGLQSLPNAYDYIQFAPVAYIVKLNIELTMAELISKVVRGAHRVDIKDSSVHCTANFSGGTESADCYFPGSNGHGVTMNTAVGVSEEKYKGEGIMKTVDVAGERCS